MYDLGFMYPIFFLFVIGVGISFLVHRFRLPSVLFLLLAGILMSKLPLPESLVLFPKSFVLGISVLAFVMLTYDVFSRARLHHNDTYAHHALELTTVMLGFSLTVLGVVLFSLGATDNPILVMVASFALAGIALPFASLHSLRLRHFLEAESAMSSALVLFVCSMLLHFVAFSNANAVTGSLVYYMGIFSLQILVGIGAGIFLGLVVFKVFRKLSLKASPIALLAIALTSYFLAEWMNGAGVFASMSLGLLFGSLSIKHKAELEEFSKTFSESIEIVLLLLLGLLVRIPLTAGFILQSLLVFAVYLALRYLAVFFVMRRHFFSDKEKWMLTAAAPKGFVLAVIALSCLLIDAAFLPLIQILVACILSSQLLAWIVGFSRQRV